jgi:asparagine synthase (glutamine-hydrolysing)
MHARRGVVLGKLFEQGYAAGCVPARVTFDEAATTEIVSSGGAKLLERWWGRYVAFVRDPEKRTSWVLRDPTGDVHCFATNIRGVDVFFNRLADCERLSPPEFSVDWRYVGVRLALQVSEPGKTGITEITEILAGECVELYDGRQSRTFYWNPLRLAVTDVIDDPDEAIEQTRGCVRACVHAWAADRGGILHLLSGGLDSSIVAACLADAPGRPDVTCLNYYSTGSDTDERRYAQVAAASAGFGLIERLRDPDISLAPFFDVPRAPFPCYCFNHLESGPGEERLANELDASVVFYGVGGDWLFYSCGPLPAATDHVYRHGITGALIVKALEAAMLDQISIWHVLPLAIRFGFLKRPWSVESARTKEYRQLVSAEVKEEAKRSGSHVHPLYRSAIGVPPCKLHHAYLITSTTSPHYNPFESAGEPLRLSPLCSQPLMELSLRIPADVLTIGGRDRAIARRAFARDLPSEIVSRKSKGGMEEHAKAIVANNIAIVRELLLDGVLANQGYLDRAGLETVLSRRPSRIESYVAEIFDYIVLEAWCRSWVGARHQAAA